MIYITNKLLTYTLERSYSYLDAHWRGAERLEILWVKYMTCVSGQHFENPYRQPFFLTHGITVRQWEDRDALRSWTGGQTIVINVTTFKGLLVPWNDCKSRRQFAHLDRGGSETCRGKRRGGCPSVFI